MQLYDDDFWGDDLLVPTPPYSEDTWIELKFGGVKSWPLPGQDFEFELDTRKWTHNGQPTIMKMQFLYGESYKLQNAPSPPPGTLQCIYAIAKSTFKCGTSVVATEAKGVAGVPGTINTCIQAAKSARNGCDTH